jgi:hypothetical protein
MLDLFLVLILLVGVMLLVGLFTPHIGLFFALPAKRTRLRAVFFWLLTGAALLWLFGIHHGIRQDLPLEKGMVIFAGVLVAIILAAIYSLRSSGSAASVLRQRISELMAAINKKRFLFLILACVAPAQPALAADAYTVQVRETRLRATPSFTGKILGLLAFGQEVTAEKEENAWILVKAKAGAVKGPGWLHRSALAEKQLSLLSGGRDAQARVDEREVSMAGKGFDRQTEQAYRAGNPRGYAQVEAMQKRGYTPEESVAFLNAGKGGTR